MNGMHSTRRKSAIMCSCTTQLPQSILRQTQYIYVEISKFNKPLEELDTLYEKWLYALKNLYKLTQRPKELCDKVF